MRKSPKMTLTSTSTKSKDDFGRSIRAAVHGLWKGHIDFVDFTDTVISAIFRGYEQAWREGEARVGVTPDERSLTERMVLDRTIQDALGSVMSFAEFVGQRLEGGGHKLGEMDALVAIWVNGYERVVNLAAATSRADQKLEWVLGRTKVHCVDCGNYAGRVHRASVWHEAGALPQSRRLECRGYNCQCRLYPTTRRGSPGRPSRPRG
jgi:hypothetical protein